MDDIEKLENMVELDNVAVEPEKMENKVALDNVAVGPEKKRPFENVAAPVNAVKMGPFENVAAPVNVVKKRPFENVVDNLNLDIKQNEYSDQTEVLDGLSVDEIAKHINKLIDNKVNEKSKKSSERIMDNIIKNYDLNKIIKTLMLLISTLNYNMESKGLLKGGRTIRKRRKRSYRKK